MEFESGRSNSAKHKKNSIYISACYFLILFLGLSLPSCFSNNPYPESESGEAIYYDTFILEPKNLDPAKSYSSNEYEIINQIYEPLVQYHFLKRPFELIPLTARSLPKERLYDKNGNLIQGERHKIAIGRIEVEIKIKPGILYENHPAFSKGENGRFIYHLAKNQGFPDIEHPNELPNKGSRELEAADYVYQIKRMANPILECPIFPILAKYIDGFYDFALILKREISKIREQRKKSKGLFYNRELDEKEDPIYLDLRKFPMKGLKIIDKYTFRIRLKHRYPQFIYWLAMPFFAPVPWEVDRFYLQSAASRLNFSLNRFPVGTGPYQLEVYKPNHRIVLLKNPNYHEDYFPKTGEAGDRRLGLLDDAGKRLPFINKAVFTLEKEDIPRWNKFLQGYYDNSGINSDVFDSALKISPEGSDLTESLKEKNIRLLTAISPNTNYYAFNMLDDVVGGLSPQKRKLRKAISIALNMEEYIEIFLNGRGIPAQSPIPPEIFGYQEGKTGLNTEIYNWNRKTRQLERKSLVYAKRLLSEAGYPNGIGPNGKPLTIFFDSSTVGAGAKSFYDWLRKQFKSINLDLQIRKTDYNQFQDKVRKGNFQMIRWGWHADYPDPENFLFLLYGPNGKVRSQGENASNYQSAEFDALFAQMENMKNSPGRLAIIKKMLSILRKDAPWIWGYHPVGYGLHHQWYKNAKPMTIGNNTLKYKKIDNRLRREKRKRWNEPVTYPLWIIIFIFSLTMIPGVKNILDRERGKAS